MNKKNKKKEQKEMRKHFEAILGSELSGQPAEIALREPIGIFNKLDGKITSREIDGSGERGKRCQDSPMLEVSGLARTDSDGKVEFLLSEYFCLSALQFQHPLNIVASARSIKPVTVSVEIALTSNWQDIKVNLASWRLTDGSPAPNTSVYWICRVPHFLEFEDAGTKMS